MPACPARSHPDTGGLGPALLGLSCSEVDAARLGAHGGSGERGTQVWLRSALPRAQNPRWLRTMRLGKASLPAGSSRTRHQQPQANQSESLIGQPGRKVESDL